MTCEHTYSDAVTGYVRAFRDNRLYLSTLDGSAVVARLAATTAVEALRNLGEPYQDVSGRLAEHLVPGRMVSCYGLFYPTAGTRLVHASRVIVIDGEDGVPRFEHPQWWVDQIRGIAGFYRHAQFGDGPVDFTRYRTELSRTGSSAGNHVQETDTISRLVYGMASAYMLSGDQSYLDVAEAGSHYLRERLRFVDEDNDVVYWYHGTEVRDGVPSRKLFTSEFGDDYEAVPAYEQIYALCGLVQTFRVTGDPRLLADIEGTVRLFQEHFADKSRGGYFSHVDPYQLSPHAESLGPNRSRKNWNSVGDHAPAYLFNLWLATGEQRYRDMLEHTFDMIVSHFWPDRSSPFVQERFHADWSPDTSWGWQQNRAVVGHNLKIVWNLMRMNSARGKHEYLKLARQLADAMPDLARDPQRGGWYDMLERIAEDGRHTFVWHDRKAWWQQEQAILAYTLLAGVGGDASDLRHGREAEAFYNAYFLDHDDGAVYFSVLANGVPYMLGTERLKGSHSMSMYHSAELCYLATVYNRLLIHGEPLDLWFRPRADAAFSDDELRVAPDVLPPGRVRLVKTTVDGQPHRDFDPDRMTVRLPRSGSDREVRVTLADSTRRES
ncbi:AGE family epimerase/isomerase [Kutzneria kofuensis]|uniref:Mannose/cellobiose epimerase-like protein (N-acyl-D-glucosamine 2-epimerase family) n=1 Tax=Kutzneria kofuensis TaxID=103725 RepID=A0A7W9NLG3_9PSEU|nr:AGE family epimerase/isomerase [Kutzneria kofuensis]MBB5896990.1 mannose/cellobiose epimerase-like protein (N-acyl-D-glucosamine 2-epimerase family) [Kutzneria kofuensis]